MVNISFLRASTKLIGNLHAERLTIRTSDVVGRCGVVVKRNFYLEARMNC
jgi:hypothetical protein